MTRMVPPTIHSSVKSAAERRLFRLIQETPGSEYWVCLHALGLARHEYKRRAEIDFCLLTPGGVYVLEVKGGRIRRQRGSWMFIDRFGDEHVRSESPFEQASSAMFALEREIKQRFSEGNIRSAAFGFGVLFPDIEFHEVGAEVAREQIYDRRDRRDPFSVYVRRLTQYTKGRFRRRTRNLTPSDIQQLLAFLRGDFDLVPLVGQAFEDPRSQLAELTSEQIAVLDAVHDTDRLIVDGPAGSGKTLLAIDAARRDARRGDRVGFLCYNRNLARMVQSQIQEEDFAGSISVRTVHRQLYEIVESSSLRDEFEQVKSEVTGDELFGELYPEYATLAAMELPSPPFDSLIVDEAQDVLTKPTLAALSELVRGSLEQGRWRVFLDANEQASVYGRLDPAALAELRHLAQREPILTFNCRNTRPIGIQLNVVTQPRQRTRCRADGPPVEYLTYRSESKLMGKLEQALNSIREMHISPNQITVLFPQVPSRQFAKKAEMLGLKRLEESDVPQICTEDLARVTWSSVSGFKGLENDVIVLVGVRELEADWWRSINYVGFSRARIGLYVVIHEDCTRLREERFARELAHELQGKVRNAIN